MSDRPLHTQDNFYRKAQFNVELDVTGPVEDEDSLHRAMISFLAALQEDTELKVSSFYDITGIRQPEEKEDAAHTETKPTARIEFVVYNKLGVTALSKMRRFFGEAVHEKMRIPRITLQSGDDTFKAENFTIRYLFFPFVYKRDPDSWDKLYDLLGQHDRGYHEMMARQKARGKTARYILVEAACGDRVFRGTPPPDTTDKMKNPGSAINVTVVPYIETLLTRATGPVYVFDFGAGQYARHANHLRALFGDQVRVYAYDKYKANGKDPWRDGGVSNELPAGQRFDLVFSTYVLNVMTDEQEDRELAKAESLGGWQVHVVRDDLRSEIRRWLRDGKHPQVVDWFLNEFATPEEQQEFYDTEGYISKETLTEFVCFGYPTANGFQRQPNLEPKGYHYEADLSSPNSWVTWVASL